jgi:hypothetical protein
MAYNVMWKVASKTANDDEVDKSKATQAIASYVTSAQAIARLVDRDQPSTTPAHDTQLVHDVLLQEVDTDAKSVGRLALGKRKTTERSRFSPFTLVLDRLPQDAHAAESYERQKPLPRPSPRCGRGVAVG